MARTENLTVMFTDIVGFTARTSRQSRAATDAMLRDHDRLLLPLISRFGGRRIKSIGDALLVTFRSPTDAVRCAMAMQDILAEHNAKLDEGTQIHIRVALNVGEVRVDRRDVLGEAVNVASRVEHLTPPDQIYFTEAVYLAMNKAEVPSAVVGVRQLRGIPEPVKLFSVPPRKISRLVPGGEDLGDLPGELPFGGMHHRATPTTGMTARLAALWAKHRTRFFRWRQRDLTTIPPLARLIPLTGALALTIAFAVWLHTRTGATASELQQSVAGTAVRAEAGSDRDGHDAIAARRNQALAKLQEGHRAFEQDQRRAATEAYGQALALMPELRDDALLARRLVACLSWASELATPLIRTHTSAPIIQALSERTGELGTRGAIRAAELLEELGQSQRIDPVLTGTRELSTASSCEDKQKAIQQLRVLGDPRALPALRESMGSGIKAWFGNSCFRGDAKAAIKEIERRHPGAAG